MNLIEKLCDRVGIIINGNLVLCDTVENILNTSPSHDLEQIFFDLYVKEGGNE